MAELVPIPPRGTKVERHVELQGGVGASCMRLLKSLGGGLWSSHAEVLVELLGCGSFRG